MVSAVGIIPVALSLLRRNENVFPILPALRIDLAVDRFDFGRVAIGTVAAAERRVIRHVPRRREVLMQELVPRRMVAMGGVTILLRLASKSK
ncbi:MULTISPECIES: hypothetical protein [unclassified Bradyrhizobium]